jgi:predicted transcriptional regulator
MNTLTTGEEAIMQVIWKLGPCTIGHIMEYYRQSKKPSELPAQTTVSTFLRILVDKGFLSYKVYGKTYEYSALISKQKYSMNELRKMIKNYFGNKPSTMVSYLVEEEQMDDNELAELIKQLKSKSGKK